MLYVFASVVAHHHLIGHHEGLDEALRADRAAVSAAGGVRVYAVILKGGRRRRGAFWAGRTALHGICRSTQTAHGEWRVRSFALGDLIHFRARENQLVC